MSRPNARWDMKRRETSSASVCMTFGITTFMYMLPSNDRTDDSAGRRKKKTRKVNFLSYNNSRVSGNAGKEKPSYQAIYICRMLHLLLTAWIMLAKLSNEIKESLCKGEQNRTHWHVPYILSMGNTQMHVFIIHWQACDLEAEAHTRCSVCRKLNHHATSSSPLSADVAWCLKPDCEVFLCKM